MITPPLRSDSYGHGEYGAKRGNRFHKGYDFACESDQSFFSVSSGRVIKIGRAYAAHDEYQTVEVRFDAQTVLRYFYVKPCVIVNEMIDRGERIGYVQDLTKIYPKTDDREAIQNHVHFEVIVEGVHVDPIKWLDQRGWL